MHKFSKILGLAIGLTIAGPTVTLSEVLDIDRALELASDYDPRIEAARSTVAAAEEEINRAWGLRKPRLSGSGSTSYTHSEQLNEFGSFQQGGTRATVGVELDQPVFTFGRFEAKRNQARAVVTEANANMRTTVAQVLLETADAFLTYQRTLNVLTAHEDHLATLEHLAEATQAKVDANLTTKTDLLLVNSRRDQARALIQTANADVNMARDRLTRLTGAITGKIKQIDMVWASENIDTDTVDATTTGLIQNPIIHAAQAREAQAQADYQFARTERSPNLSLRGRATRGRMKGAPIGSEELSLVFNVPLYDRGIARSNIRGQRHLWQQRKSETRTIQREVENQIRDAVHLLSGNTMAAEAWMQSLHTEELALEGIEQEVDEGLRPVTHLLEAKEDLLLTRTRTQQAIYEAILSYYRLKLEMGNLDATTQRE